MADNIQITQGSGTTMATDEVGGVHYPRMKLVIGVSDVGAGSPLPVAISATGDLATEATLSKVATEETLSKVATEATLSKVATEATLSGLSGIVATESTLSKVATEETLAKVATEATLSSLASTVATEATLSSLASTVATEATLSSLASTVATEATLEKAVAVLQPATARQLAAGAASANTALTASVRRVSIRAVGAAIRYAVGTGSQTASATSHFIAQDERLEIAVPLNANIAVIRNDTTDGTIELSELV